MIRSGFEKRLQMSLSHVYTPAENFERTLIFPVRRRKDPDTNRYRQP